MCGRFANAREVSELAEELAATIAAGAEAWRGSYNIAPSRDAPILVEVPARRLGLARFGLSTSRGGLLVNARAEGLAETFAEAASRRRCVVPATGFYEWRARGRTRADKVPHYAHAEHGELLFLAAIYDVLHDTEGGRHSAFAIVTVPATEPLSRIHHRMPLVVPAGLLDSWLLRGELDVGAALDAIGRATPVRLVMHAVSSAVSSAANEGPELIAPRSGDGSDGDPTGWLDFD